MRKKSILKIGISLLVFCILLGAYFFLKQLNKEESEEETTSEEVFSASSDEIEKISFDLEGEKVTFVKSDDEWKDEQDNNFPVDQSKIESILDGLTSVTSSRSITDAEDLDEYGLKTPSQTITIDEDDETTRTIQMGDYNETADAYYAMIDQSDTVYLLESSFESLFEGTLYDFAEDGSFPVISASDIDRIQVQKSENSYTLTASSDVSSGWLVESDGTSEEADSTAVSTTTSSVNSLSYLDFVNYNCEDYSAYGLEQPQATIVIDYHQTSEDSDEEESDDADSEKETEEEQIQVTLLVGTEIDDAYYVCVSGSKEIYTMSKSSLDSLIDKSISDYWNLKVNYYAITDINSITVNYNGEEDILSVKSETKDDEVEYSYYVNDKETDENDFKNFFNALVNISAEERLEENYQPSGDAKWVFKFKTGEREETVSYYTYNENFDVAVKDNGNSYLVNKMDVRNLESLIETLREES